MTGRSVDPPEVRLALAEAAAVGPFFRLTADAAGPPWQHSADLYRDGLPRLLDAAAARLGSTEARVTASIVQLGYAARLWSPVLCCALLHGIVPDLAELRVAAVPQLRLGLARLRGWRATDPGRQAALIYQTVVEQHLQPLAQALPVKIAPGLLRGNAASAMTGALGVLAQRRPELRSPARELAVVLLATGTLRGTGRLTGQRLDFVRKSCCLYYRVPGGGTCSDCPLDRPASALR
jgi:ferric iron reductase protein FhuF